MSRPMVWWFGVWAAPVAWLTVTGPAAAQVTFEWATVPGPCNPADPLYSGTVPGIGMVCYEYRIAKHEVTNAQYAAFLNAVAATDTNNLYNPMMNSDTRGGITRSGSPGSYTYGVKANMGDKPVGFVSFFDAMRFVNWLQNRQPTGAQVMGTTEAGAYFIVDGLSEARAPGATFFIPSENEWYKAAFHQPADAGGDADDYWLYATASNVDPTNATATATGDVANPGANVANYSSFAAWNGLNGNVTTVGSAGPASASYYGTFDQGGNVFEWIELLDTSGCTPQFRFWRGGNYATPALALRSSFRESLLAPTLEGNGLGFRVAGVTPASADFDLDLDVDLRDFQEFQNRLGGPK